MILSCLLVRISTTLHISYIKANTLFTGNKSKTCLYKNICALITPWYPHRNSSFIYLIMKLNPEEECGREKKVKGIYDKRSHY